MTMRYRGFSDQRTVRLHSRSGPEKTIFCLQSNVMLVPLKSYKDKDSKSFPFQRLQGIPKDVSVTTKITFPPHFFTP